MTRRRKRILGSIGGGLTAFVVVIGPWPLDRQPDAGPQAAALALVTQAGDDLQERHISSPVRTLTAGWAAEPFSLPAGVPLAGYGARRGAASTGTREGDILAARCLALRSGEVTSGGSTVAIICADLLLVNAPIAEAVESEIRTRLSPDSPHLIFTATHTHSGPGGWGDSVAEELIAGSFDPEVERELIRALSASVVAATEAMAPASYAWIETEAPQFLRNRTVPGGPVDATLEALAVKRVVAGAEETGILALFGAHSTCLPDENLLLSADYPGRVVRAIEAADTVDFAAFAAGNMGSHSPVAPGQGEERAAHLGTGLAALLLERLATADFRSSARLTAARFELPTPDLQMRFGTSLRLSPVATGWIHEPRARFSVLRLDDRLWMGVPLETSGLLSAPLRAEAKRAGLSGFAISNFQGDYLGYLLPDSLFAEGSSYEARMSFLGPTGGSYFTELMRTLIATQRPAGSEFPSSQTSG